MTDVSKILDKQAKWQASLRDLPWPEKVRMAAKIRDSVLLLRGGKPSPLPGSADSRRG